MITRTIEQIQDELAALTRPDSLVSLLEGVREPCTQYHQTATSHGAGPTVCAIAGCKGWVASRDDWKYMEAYLTATFPAHAVEIWYRPALSSFVCGVAPNPVILDNCTTAREAFYRALERTWLMPKAEKE